MQRSSQEHFKVPASHPLNANIFNRSILSPARSAITQCIIHWPFQSSSIVFGSRHGNGCLKIKSPYRRLILLLLLLRMHAHIHTHTHIHARTRRALIIYFFTKINRERVRLCTTLENRDYATGP